MNSLELLKVLLSKLEAYEATKTDKNSLSLEEFLASLLPSIDLESLENSFVKSNALNSAYPESKSNTTIERVIAQHFLILNRYIKHYSKLVFMDSPIKSLDEFSFLILLMQDKALPKTELIRRNVYEKSSGIEVINRLIKSKLLLQSPNPQDKRSQLVSLTNKGKSSLIGVFENMNTLGEIASGDLTAAEKNALAILLKKLDRFHLDNYHAVDSTQLEDFLP